MPRAKLRRPRKRAACGFALESTSGYGLRCSGAASMVLHRIRFGCRRQRSWRRRPGQSIPDQSTRRSVSLFSDAHSSPRPREATRIFQLSLMSLPRPRLRSGGLLRIREFGGSRRTASRRFGRRGATERVRSLRREFSCTTPQRRLATARTRKFGALEELDLIRRPGRQILLGSSTGARPGVRSASPSGMRKGFWSCCSWPSTYHTIMKQPFEHSLQLDEIRLDDFFRSFRQKRPNALHAVVG
jgi:hypothetical protein